MKESVFQRGLIRELKERFPECVVLKNDANYIQGIPDLLVLYKNRWAALECKQTVSSNRRPNQEYYIDKMNDMSFARFICKENKKEVLDELQHAWEP